MKLVYILILTVYAWSAKEIIVFNNAITCKPVYTSQTSSLNKFVSNEEISADDTTHANIGCSSENYASTNEIYPNTAKKKIVFSTHDILFFKYKKYLHYQHIFTSSDGKSCWKNFIKLSTFLI